MYLIKPCCAPQQMQILRSNVGNAGTVQFEGYGDLSLTELLPALLTRYNNTELLIAAPTMPAQATDIITKWMRWQWAKMDGSGKVDVIKHLTIVTNLRKRKSAEMSQWLKDNPFGERLTLCDVKQTDTAILLPDFAIVGPVNMQYGYHFVATATGKKEDVDALWQQYTKLTVQKEEKEEGESMEDVETTLGNRKEQTEEAEATRGNRVARSGE